MPGAVGGLRGCTTTAQIEVMRVDIRLCRVHWFAACVAGAALVVATGHDDPAGPPTRSLALVALGAVGWTMLAHPPFDDGPARRVSHAWSSAALVAVIVTLAPLVVLVDRHRADLTGVLVAALVLATYLRTWGHRAPARLRWTVVMCTLVVPAVSAALYDALETVIRLVSEIVYRRLSSIELFGVADEPWKLFSAMPRTGSFFVVALLILGSAMCMTRGMSTMGTVLYLLSTSVVGLVAHHSIILSLPIEDYSPRQLVEVATSPVTEAAAAVLAVALFGLVTAPGSATGAENRATAGTAGYVDPMIYAVPERSRLLPLAGLGMGALGAVVLVVGAQVL
jgi:hypothetical protein